MSEKKFELRELKSADLFPMFGILSKIGFKELKDSLSVDTIKTMVDSVNGKAEDSDTQTTILGFGIIMEVVEVIMKNLPKCEKEIYSFLAGVSGMTAKEIADLDMVTFTEMVIAVIQKDEFKDFFRVVSGLFK